MKPYRKIALLAFWAMAVAGCVSPSSHSSKHQAFQQQVIDGHADFAVHYMMERWSVDAHDIETSLPGQADVPRWRDGGVVGAVATVGSDLPPGSRQHFPRVLVSLDWLTKLVGRHSRSLTIARSAADFDAARQQGLIALLPAIEGGDQLDGSLPHLREAYARGVRSMTIVYDHHNQIGDGAMAMPGSARIAAAAHEGLSPFGLEVVAEMNNLGMVIDLTHAAESTALQAIEASKAPVMFSHSGAQALARTPRNLSDQVLRSVAANGGIVMVPLVPYLTTTAHWEWWIAGERRYAELTAEHEDETETSSGMAEWEAANPQPKVTIAEVADQIEYVARIAGTRHVGIGTDFDGMGSFAIEDVKDASMIPMLIAELRRRGWSAPDLHKLAQGNFLRVLQSVEAAAQPSS